MKYVAINQNQEIIVSNLSIDDNVCGSVRVITSNPKKILQAPVYLTNELDIDNPSHKLISIDDLSNLPNVEQVFILKLTIEQRAEALRMYVNGFGLSNIAQHFGLNSDEMRLELNNKY